MSEQVAASTINTQAAQGGVLFKLVIFSVALGVLPLSSYYISLKHIWDGNATFAAITAIVTANIVLVAYIIMSVLEDRDSRQPSKIQKERVTETKKEK